MQNNTSIAARRDILTAALATGPHTDLLVELAGRFEAELRFAEAAEADDDTEVDHGRSGPLSDSELLAIVVAAGSYSGPVEALVRAFAGVVAEHHAYDRGEVA